MRNALFWALVAVVAVILALIAYGIYLSVTRSPPGVDIVGAVCLAVVVVGALLAWEALMKPGYYRRRREPEEPEGPEGPSR